MDGPVRSAKAFSLRAAFAEVGRRMSAGTRAGLSTRAVFLLALASMISAAAWFPFWSEWQPYFLAHLGSRIEIIGWVFCLFSIAQIAGAEVASRMRWAREDRALYMTWNVGLSSAVLLAGGLAASKVGLAASKVGLAFAMFMVAQFLGGAAGPIEQSWFNEQIEGDNRATLLSFGSTFATFGATAGLPVQGLIVDKLGTGSAWQGAGALAMLQVPVFLALRRKRG